ncbi:MAG: zinc-dependent metalloprotease [Vicinamibacteraceae bacterium]
MLRSLCRMLACRTARFASLRVAGTAAIAVMLVAHVGRAQPPRRATREPPATIATTTAGMKKIDGFIPLYWDEREGKIWMEIARLGVEILHSAGFGAGLGSNDIGIDRGQLAGSRIVVFERVGPKVLMVQPNYQFRASSDNAAEMRAVRDAFARSVLWGFTVAAESDGRVLVDATDWLVRDGLDIARRLRPGTYRFDETRSAAYLPGTFGFPTNTEIEAELTFVQEQREDPPEGGPAPGPGLDFGGDRFFEGVGDVAATTEAASVRVHHSFIELPDAGYKPRRYDPRAGYSPVGFRDYAAPLGEPMEVQFIRRHRLAKQNPTAQVSDPVQRIVYYLDPGAPEPIRSALLEGARWWNQAFEAAGYRNAFRVKMLPEGAHPLDARYNVINWVHRSTRGWSTGASITDPRTGEIIKGVVTLGSLRVRQDYLLAEGLLSPYAEGTETPPALAEWALARIRQLSAHEVGHTLGLAHNYYNSSAGRISVMDYPHPLVTLASDGSLDYSSVYTHGIGAWDKAAIVYGYQDFAPGTEEQAALASILDQAWNKDVRFLTNQDTSTTPRADEWANGTDQAAELTRMMEVRRTALARFGEQAIKRGRPMATIEEALVPLFLHHRYQVEAAASALGGLEYEYALRGDGRTPTRRVPAAQQRAALEALVATIQPANLRVPQAVLDSLPPRPMGYGPHRELFPRYTGGAFDAITPAVVAAHLTISNVLDAERAARLVQQHALAPSLPGLGDVLDALVEGSFDAVVSTPYDEQIKSAVERVLAEQLMDVAAHARMAQVRAVATERLQRLVEPALRQRGGVTNESGAMAARSLLGADITRFLERPAAPVADRPVTPPAPPGAPIGDPGPDWLPPTEACGWE